MSGHSNLNLAEKVGDIFQNIVEPVFGKFIEGYGDAPGYEVKLVPDGPLIMGIDRCASIMFKHPNGLEMIVCVYWVSGSERLIAENIRMVTLNKTFDLFSVTEDELEKQIGFLAGLKL
jgi:hypothetical protein